MLKITERAASLLRGATSTEEAQDAGIRIERGAVPSSIDIGISDQPEDGDMVVEENGLLIFVEDSLIDTLDNRTLDVRDDDEGPQLVFYPSPLD